VKDEILAFAAVWQIRRREQVYKDGRQFYIGFESPWEFMRGSSSRILRSTTSTNILIQETRASKIEVEQLTEDACY